MKVSLLILISMISSKIMLGQEIIKLPVTKMKGVTYENEERIYYSKAWKTTVVSNVSEPSISVYRPSSDRNNGTAVIIAPGGGLYGLSINSEGVDVANWFVSKGVTAFVLKYRLIPTKETGTDDFHWPEDEILYKQVDQVLPYAIEDGLNAISYVRQHAKKYGIKPNKIGFMGFSAGGAVTMGTLYNYQSENRPDFLVPVYPWTYAIPVKNPPADSPPMMIICATDDGLGLAKGSIELYNSYLDNGLNVALHMYAKGDHGFGMKTQGFPSDTWIDRVYEWAIAEGLILPAAN